MTKLYYDNAIDALYMAEKFGVKVTDLGGRVYSLDCFFACMEESLKEKYYIAPESLEAFEPIDGDVVLNDDAEPKIVIKQNSGRIFWHEDEDYGYCYRESLTGIIQRNNTAFISPKSEVCDED